MSEIIKIGNAEIEKSNYNYFSTLYSKIPKEYVIADLVSKCEEYNKLYKSYEELEVKEMQKEDLLTELEEWLKENIKSKPLQTTYFFKCDGKQKSISGIELEELKRVDNKIKELKEKYK